MEREQVNLDAMPDSVLASFHQNVGLIYADWRIHATQRASFMMQRLNERSVRYRK